MALMEHRWVDMKDEVARLILWQYVMVPITLITNIYIIVSIISLW